ncbi:ankyrin repeat and SOCS box protein 2-like [Mercenaria mercenaria]|uniref:ankyrin repeat and SOCS box protein 2-like n=1 Tax=Mercenaria mercenaria TaxID=6596 RepID=UPI00234F6823|nr:ankyrin repeat and SOCS box protein 2-like [Mercenaria mercenaria]
MGQMLNRPPHNEKENYHNIIKAVESGNLHQLIKRFADLEPTSQVQAIRKDGKTLLHIAAYHHQLDCIQFLLEHGFDANVLDDFGNTPLVEVLQTKAQDRICLALHNPNCLEKLVNLFLKFKADINARSSVYRTALLKSMVHRHRLSEILLKNGADPNIADADGLLPIHVCATYSCLSLLKHILTRGADINGHDGKERTALYFSVLAGHQKIFDELILHGCDINKGSKYGFPLQTAIIKCRLEMVQTLLQNGADVQCKISEFRQLYCRTNDYLNLALLVAHSQINNPGLSMAKEDVIENAKKSLQILYLVIQAVGNNENFSRNAFVKTRRQPLDGPDLLVCNKLFTLLLRKLAFIHGMSRNSKPLDGLPNLGSVIDTLSLQNVCRMKVRQLISKTGTNVIFAVEQLDCSQVLKDVILLKDVV